MNRSFILLVLCLVLISSSGEEKIQPSPSEAWTQLASMPTARSENAAAVVEHTIYVSGGFGGKVLTGENHALTSVEAFDPQRGVWEFGPNLPLALHGVPAVNVDGTIYVLGGADRAGAISNQGLVFSLKP